MAGTISIGGPYVVDETTGTVRVQVNRTGDLTGTVTVGYNTGNGSAVAGEDYAAAQGSLTFRKNQTSQTIPISILDDTRSEGNETFSVVLTTISGGSFGDAKTASVTIRDNEAPGGGTPPPPPPPTLEVREEVIVSNLGGPISFDWVPGRSTMVIAEKSGLIKARDPSPDTGGGIYDLLDLRPVVNDTVDRGLIDIELHPNFASNPYLYAYFAVDPPDVKPAGTNDGMDGNGNRYVHLDRYTVATDGSGRLSVDPASKVTLLGAAGTSLSSISGKGLVDSTAELNQAPSGINSDGSNIQDYIAADSLSHAAGSLEFAPDGSLLVTVGDGASFNFMDPRAVRVQDIGNLSGKVLRINPLNGDGLADNPFFNGNPDSNQSKVWELGVRNAFRSGFDSDGDFFLGDVGWYSWEEINTGGRGANFGWPYFEGGPDGSVRQSEYQNLSKAQAFYNSGAPVVAPFEAFSHSGVNGYAFNAIVFGDVSTGTAYPSWLQGRAFFSNLSNGEVYSVNSNDPTASVAQLTQHNGTIVFMDQGPDGRMYYADIYNGTIGRWQITSPTIDIRLDTDPDRSGAVDLNNATVTGNMYVFLGGNTSGVRQVQFLIDGAPTSLDTRAPFDLVGGNNNRSQAFDTRTLAEGEHTLSAVATYNDGRTASVTDTFIVDNIAGTAATFDLRAATSANGGGSQELQGRTIGGPNNFIFLTGDTTGVERVEFEVDDRIVRTDWRAPFNMVSGFSARDNDPFDVRVLPNGQHTFEANIFFTDGSSTTVTSLAQVQNDAVF
jgi:glucose/arabinose dehydrogenase